MTGVSAEFALVAACCRWPSSPTHDDAIRAAASGVIDWGRFEQVAARHRVTPLVCGGLRHAGVTPPPETEARLAAASRASAFKNLGMAAETLRLQTAFDEADLPAIILKGASLAALAYGTLAIKESWDIDLLVARENALAGRDLLQRLGYVPISPSGFSDEKFLRHVVHCKEAVFAHPQLRTAVELHWSLVDNPHVLAPPDLEAVQSVSIGDGQVRTLADEALYAYLCVHGCNHSWSRLKWLADVAAYLARRSPDERMRLHQAAGAGGAGRASGVAIQLCHRLLGLEVDADLLARLRADRMAGILTTSAMASLGHGGGTREITPYSRPWAMNWLAKFWVSDSVRYTLAQARLNWTGVHDRVHLPLPRGFGFLYHLLRLPLWAFRLVGQKVRRVRAA